MVNYPDLSNLNNQSGIAGLMALPNSSYPYFWAWIFFAIWVIITATLYFKEQDKQGKGKILSSMAVSSMAIIILSAVGTLLTIVSQDIMIYSLVINILVIAVWWFTSK